MSMAFLDKLRVGTYWHSRFKVKITLSYYEHSSTLIIYKLIFISEYIQINKAFEKKNV